MRSGYPGPVEATPGLIPSRRLVRLAALVAQKSRRSACNCSGAFRWEGSGIVKLVIGIVRPEKANDVLESLFRAEVRGLSISRVQGHGGELDRVETYRGTTVKMGLAEKVRFEIAVSDAFVQPTIDALCAGARTGEVGDGKIFVLPMERAVRIRTGETDHGAVTPVGV
jgi:nitrogen regulatory protein P-II 1